MNGSLFRWRFGSVEYDEARRELRVAGLAVEMENRPLEVLSLLLRHVGQVVTKQALFEQVWTGRPTVDHVLATAVGKLRKVLDAAGESRIATVPRVGYRFDGTLERMAVGQQGMAALRLEPGQPVPGRASLVLERRLGRTVGNEIWLARHPRSREARVFKFVLDGDHLAALKREATLARVLQESLGERADLVRVLDWNFEQAPFYLECEYAGQSLPEWADAGRLEGLDRQARIELFVQIVDAVAAAHGVGVLHQDLKPSNVLLAEHGGRWRMKLGDFGNSRLLQPERLVELGITGLGLTVADGERAGTPLYLAPELIAGHAASVRSDVYALGVMLYQWLAGNLLRPLASGWQRDIDDVLLREDIALATDVEPARRLGSAADLAERLRGLPHRHAERERRAADERAAEALRAALARNRARRPWLVAVIGVLGLGVVCSSLLWWQSDQQRRIAQLQAARAEASLGFFDHALYTLSTGNSGYAHDPTIRDMLEYLDASGGGSLPADPKVRGDIHALLGRSWRLLGEPARGVAEYRAAVADYTRAFGAGDPRTLEIRYALVRALAYMQTVGAFAEAGALLDDTDRLAGERLRQGGELALRAALERGIFHLCRSQPGPALRALQAADALRRRIAPADAAMAALIGTDIAEALLRAGEPARALAALQAMAADPLLSPARVGQVSLALRQSTSASALHALGHDAQARPLAAAAAQASGRFLGPDNYYTLVQQASLASIDAALGDCAAALPLARQTHERMNRQLGPDMQASIVQGGDLGEVELACGQRGPGLAHLRQAEQRLRGAFGAEHPAARRFALLLARERASSLQ